MLCMTSLTWGSGIRPAKEKCRQQAWGEAKRDFEEQRVMRGTRAAKAGEEVMEANCAMMMRSAMVASWNLEGADIVEERCQPVRPAHIYAIPTG